MTWRDYYEPNSQAAVPGEAALLRARLEVLRTDALRGRRDEELLRLEVEAIRRLGAAHRVSLECAGARLDAQARRRPATDIAVGYEMLAAACLDEFGSDDLSTKKYEQLASQHRRRAGAPDWETSYRAIVEDREREHGRDSTKARVARLNLAVAFRGAAEDPELPEVEVERCLREAREGALGEWQSRRASHSENNPFTWIAAAVYCNVALTAAYRGRPIEQPDRLVELTADVVRARQRLLGARHRRTLSSRITHAQALAQAGHQRQAVWRLLTLQAEAYDVGLDAPETLPTMLARALLGYGTSEARSQAAHYRAEAAAVVDEKYGPDSRQARWLSYVLDEARLPDPVALPAADRA